MTLPARYQFTGNTNSGGMGDIHHCVDTHLNRPVVLKMLKDGGNVRRLVDEQLALIKVRSKHVVQLFDVVSVDSGGTPKTALVLEHIDGNDLCVESFAPDQTYLKTIWQVACGLVEIHSEGIIHRDIKPNNIRVGADGIVKILDFGLARSTGIEAKTRSVIGTPGFMAPELWQNPDISFDHAIDVYAFGITAMVLLTLDIPPQLKTHPPSKLPSNSLVGRYAGVPNDVLEMIEKCLSYKSTDRPSMRDVEVILRNHLLFNRHRALLVLRAETHEINSTSPNVVVKSGALGEIGIHYDGTRFTVTSIVGVVKVNNTSIAIGDNLPSCCVIAFGTDSRSFVTFDVSNPEVMP